MRIPNNGNNGTPFEEPFQPESTGTFPVSVALRVSNLRKFIEHMRKELEGDNDSTLLLFFNRTDVHLSDNQGILRITLNLD